MILLDATGECERMKAMKLSVVLVSFLGMGLSLADSKEGAGQWVALFNGKDLSGWTPKFAGYEAGENVNDTFRVEEGILKVSYEDYEEWGELFGHLFFEKEFSHYKLRVEYRFVGEQVEGAPSWAFRNNGLMIHGQSLESMEVGQKFPRSIEVQLLGGDGESERPTANVCTPETQFVRRGEVVTEHCVKSDSPTFHGDQWVTVEVEVRGSERIIHRVNGAVVFEYEYPQLDDGSLIERGTISIQAESAPTEFRKIEIMELSPEVGAGG